MYIKKSNECIEIIIDDLIPRDNIKLIEYNKIIYIHNFNIVKTIISYKLITSYIYNLLMEQLCMRDSLIILITNNYSKNKYI